MLCQNAASDIAPYAALANNVQGLIGYELIQAASQFVNGNVPETIDVPALVFANRANIQQLYAAVARQFGFFVLMPLFYYAVVQIFDHEAGHVYGVFCRRIRGSVR